MFHNQPPVLKYCTANISYGFNCSEVLGTYRGSSNTNSVTTTVISMVGGVTEYCYNVTANVENNMTVHMVVVEGTLNLHVEGVHLSC